MNSPDIQWSQVARGFLDTHSRMNSSIGKTLEVSSFVYSLVELLSEKGLVSIEELDARQQVVSQRLEEQLRQKGVSVTLQDPEFDKYTYSSSVEIDCPSRIALCRAACCKLPFALSRQDVKEGIVHWDLGNPYIIAHGPEGYCEHLDGPTCSCTVRDNRPVPCRAYDCRNEKRIWLDFENRMINPRIYLTDWPYCEDPTSSPPCSNGESSK
jgi:hypothetical protein